MATGPQPYPSRGQRSGVPRRAQAVPSHRRSRAAEVLDTWRSQPLALRVLRAFLGLTFTYAGIQKFADPSFFDASSPQSIQSQLRAFAQGTPLRPVLVFLTHLPVLSGIGIALLEISIGLATLLGIGLVAATAAGFAVNVALWLSATWHVYPYFLGSDSIYAVAWLALLVGILEGRRDRGRVATAPPLTQSGLARRDLLRGGAVAAASVVIGGLAHVFAGSTPSASAGLRAAARAGHAQRPSGAQTAPSRPATSPSASPRPKVRGKPIASLDRINVGDAIAFTDPGLGPAVLVRTSRNKVVAYSRICTHAGCEVGYDASRELLVCPCHGAEFDPTKGARPVAGPAPTPLPSIRVEIDPTSGEVVLPQS